MNPIFSKKDEDFMRIAIEQGNIALKRGDLPVGAILTIDGQLIGQISNNNTTTQTWTGHAELMLIQKYAKEIREAVKRDKTITIYTTLEPCIMCFGASVMNRVSKIVYACPDPRGGACDIKKDKLKIGYHNRWPVSSGGLLGGEAFDLFIKYMENRPTWVEMLTALKEMGRPENPVILSNNL